MSPYLRQPSLKPSVDCHCLPLTYVLLQMLTPQGSRETAQAQRRRTVTAETKVRSQPLTCGFCGRQIGGGTDTHT